MLNRFIALILLVLIAPVFLFIIVFSWIKCGNPVFFVQERIGYRQKPFNIYKFRTLRNSNKAGGNKRTSSIGHFLRKWKLDETPSLINIVKGDMVFVGPRPFIAKQAAKVKESQMDVFSVKPGITCPASIKYINEEVLLNTKKNPKEYNLNHLIPEKIKMNLDYVHRKSFWYDAKIIYWTLIQKKFD